VPRSITMCFTVISLSLRLYVQTSLVATPACR